MARTALNSLTNYDYSDRELLHILNDTADAEGWAETADLAEVIGVTMPSVNGQHSDREKQAYAHRCTAMRFSWMARYGWVERDEGRTKWRLTDIGHDLMDGKLTKTLQNALDRLDAGDRVLVMREIGNAYRAAPDPARHMLRREGIRGFRHSMR